MRIATIVGARPQFIKAAPVSKALRKTNREILIHTGQHYDPEMSRIFFEELKLPKPDYNLGVGSGNPGWQVGTMLVKIEATLMRVKPDLVLVYGDTNSTLAGALSAAKLNLPLAHVEAGLRARDRKMQEEKNRVVTDHLAKLLFCPTQSSVGNLKREGIVHGVHLTGDVMMDSLKLFLPEAQRRSKILETLHLEPKSYLLTTVHRAENTDDPGKLLPILTALSKLEQTVIFPVHPRTRKAIRTHGFKGSRTIKFISPLGYLDMLVLEKNAAVLVTDSGGIQKEAYFLNVPCVTLRDETEWTETLRHGRNILAGSTQARILAAVKKSLTKTHGWDEDEIFGDGNASAQIARLICKA